MSDRKDFSQTELLKYLGQFTVNRARCEKCGITALDKKLNLHHRDGNSANDSIVMTIIILLKDEIRN